jgi:hypothetical protein
MRPAREHLDTATADRQYQAKQPVEEGEEEYELYGDAERVVYDEERGVLRVRVGRHWWRVEDPTCGVRTYSRPSGAFHFWTGFYNVKLACRTFSLPVVNLVEAADEAETSIFPDALAALLHIVGEDHVRSISGDAGIATKPVYSRCLEHGITPVTPQRRYKGEPEEARDFPEFDRDGIPRCKFCGGETEFVRFANNPKPRLWFKCKRPRPECLGPKPKEGPARAKEQTIVCSKDPRYLIPLWRNTSAYQALTELGLSNERNHHLARARYANGGKNHPLRPKRRGRDWQQLRAQIAVCNDWLKMLWRQGWLPDSECRNHEQPYFADGDDFVRKMEAERRIQGLTRPYGPAAMQFGGPEWPTDEMSRVIDADPGHGRPIYIGRNDPRTGSKGTKTGTKKAATAAAPTPDPTTDSGAMPSAFQISPTAEAVDARDGDDVPQVVLDAIADERAARDDGGGPPEPPPGEPPGDPPPATADDDGNIPF